MKIDRIARINEALDEYFTINPSIKKIPAKDLMRVFISKGAFPNDSKNGLPIRKLLRDLDDSKELHLIPYVLAERKSKNTSWFFIPRNILLNKTSLSKPVDVIRKTTPSKSPNTHLKKSFPPIVNERCEILILGSLPGDESLLKGEYYANARNGFWKIAECIFNEHPHSYQGRINLLLNNKIALWDVLENAERRGSLDNNIESGIPNDFSRFYKQYPNIKYVFFNGAKAHEYYVKLIGVDNKHIFELLPSSSSARAMSIDAKVESWKKICTVRTE